MKLKRYMSIFISIVSVFLLAACTSATEPEQINKAENKEDASSVSLASDMGMTYSGQMLLPPDGEVFLYDAASCGGTLFLYGLDAEKQAVFYKMDTVGTSLERLSIAEEMHVVSICDCQDERLPILTIDEDGNYVICIYSGDKPVESLTLSGIEELDGDMLTCLSAARNGFILFTSDKILVLDKNGRKTAELGEYYRSAQCIFTGSGQIIISREVLNKPGTDVPETEVLVLDETMRVTASYCSEQQFSAFYKDGGAEDTILAYAVNTVYRYNYKTGGREAVINTQLSGMTPNVLVRLSEDSFLGVNGGRATVWRPSDGSKDAVITLATYQPSFSLQELVKQYNESSAEYKISIADYSAYDMDGGEETGMTRLRADIIAGFAPDLYDLSVLPAGLCIKQGLLEDLTPYFGEGISVALDDISENIIKALLVDEKIYYIMPSYSILTVCGDGELVGTGGAWIPKEFLSAVQGIEPEAVFGPEMTRDRFLANVLLFQGKRYADTENSVCNFTDSDFKDLLEFASKLPEACDYSQLNSQSWARAYTGEQLLLMEWFGDSAISFASFTDNIYNGRAQFVGFPAEASGGAAVVPSALFGVSVSSSNKDGAIDFVRFALSDIVQANRLLASDFPVVEQSLRDRLEIYKERYQKLPEVLYSYDGNAIVEINGVMPVEDAEACVLSMIAKADLLAAYDNSLIDIVLRECQPYFAGNINVEQTIENIQSKAQIYVSEQYG